MSRTENSLRNMKAAVLFQALSIVTAFFTRKVFVAMLTQEYLGLNGTFGNILSMLSLAELGVGNAITYSLYKPLAEGDRGQIVALMALYRRAYHVIGAVVAVVGCALTPFLPVLIKDFPDIPHIYVIYLLFVLNSALSYFCVYKQSLIMADQQQYIITACRQGLNILLHISQALFLWMTHNYFSYLGLQIGFTLLENLVLAHWADKRYPYTHSAYPNPLSETVRQEIVRNTKALMIHKVGGVVVFGTDNLLISYFVGSVAVGLYSNYLMVINGLNSVYGQLFRAMTASVGNLGATAGPEQAQSVFRKINLVGNWLYGFSAVCLIVLFNPFITLWVGREYLFSQEIVYLIALNFYVTGMRQIVLTFREAYGLYWYDRYKPIAESIINLVVSIILAVPFGIAGIFVGTFVSTMTTCFWIEPTVLFKHGLHASAKPFFREYVVNTLITLLTVAVVWGVCSVLPGTGLALFLEKIVVCAVLGNAGYLAVYCRRDEFWYYVDLFKGQLEKLLRRK